MQQYFLDNFMNHHISFILQILKISHYFFYFDYQNLDLRHHMNFHIPHLLPMSNIKPNLIIYLINFYIPFDQILWLKCYLLPIETIALVSKFFDWILNHLAYPCHFENIHHLLNYVLSNLAAIPMFSIDEIQLNLYLILNCHHFANSSIDFYLHYHFDHNWIKSLLRLQSHNRLIPFENLQNCLPAYYFLRIHHSSQFSTNFNLS